MTSNFKNSFNNFWYQTRKSRDFFTVISLVTFIDVWAVGATSVQTIDNNHKL